MAYGRAAPTLFSIYFNALVTRWRSQCEEVGVTVMVENWWEIEL